MTLPLMPLVSTIRKKINQEGYWIPPSTTKGFKVAPSPPRLSITRVSGVGVSALRRVSGVKTRLYNPTD